MTKSALIKFPRPACDAPGVVTVAFEGVMFPIRWGEPYYAATADRGLRETTCTACSGSGKVPLREEQDYPQDGMDRTNR